MNRHHSRILAIGTLALLASCSSDAEPETPVDPGPTQYSLAYDENGATGGTAPVDPTMYEEGDSITVAGPNDLTATGYTFEGWNSQAAGGGTDYAPGGMATMPASDMTLFAVWELIPPPTEFSITYDGNGSTGGSPPVDASLYEQGDTVTVLGAATLERTGFNFVGWNTLANSMGTAYADGDTFSMPGTNTTLYAEWFEIPPAGVTLTPGDTQISVAWTEVANATEYFVYYSDTDDFTGPPAPTQLNESVGVITTTSASITGLTNNVAQYVWVTGNVAGSEALVTAGSETATPSSSIPSVIVSDIEPGENAVSVALDKQVVVPFNVALDPATVNDTNVLVTVDGQPVVATINYDAGNQAITIDPPGGTWGEGALVEVELTTGITTGGNPVLTENYSFSMTTLSNAELLGRWTFNNSGLDVSGNSLDATLTSTTYDAVSLHEGSHSLACTTSSGVDIGTVDLGDTFTYTAWVNVTSASSILTLFANGSAGFSQDGIKVFVNEWGTTNAAIVIESGNGSAGKQLLTPPGFVTFGDWFHVGVSIHRSTGEARFYFNGELSPTTDSVTGLESTTIRDDFGNNKQMYLNHFVGGSFRFQGKMDDVRLYNRILTASEIRNIANEQ